MLSPKQEMLSTSKPVKYGEILILGHNGSLLNGDRGRRKSRFSLFKRPRANGVKPSVIHSSSSPDIAEVISSKDQHSVSYTLSRAQTVVVEYSHDGSTDMFQIGRSTESPIDFVVMDSGPGCHGNTESALAQSTISRFACRIMCQRTPPHTARIYAAGFDSSNNIFLGEKAAKWCCADGQMDGLTTNGVLVMQPRHGFTCESRPGRWREISICGNVYTLRDSRSAHKFNKQVEGETHELLDGCLIDLCGATLLWRSPEGLSRTPTPKLLACLWRELSAARPVGLQTLSFPARDQPWLYLRCGHVWTGRRPVAKDGSTEEEEDEECEMREEEEQECPLCRTRGPYVLLHLGAQSGFYVDCGPPTHAFMPCGHVCSEWTASFWSRTCVPHGARGFYPSCPFCMRPLSRERSSVRLTLQTPLH